jgi:NAD(P)-dependent dehydrogenase (short-subunit alcohol dehydrogenase family)
MTESFARKRIAISGAAGGIGSTTARLFHEHGASLVLMDANADALAALKAEFGTAQTILCDQRDQESIAQAVDATGTVDIFVNCAGIIIRKPLFDMTTDEITNVLSINLTGGILMAVGIAKAMAKQGSGIVVNLSSQHAFIGARDRAIYAATKAAITQFTKTAAVEWAPFGVRVIALAPGPVDSPMTAAVMKSDDYRKAVLDRMPIGRFLSTAEMAAIILHLCSPDMASFVGQTFIADGGASLT